MVEAVHMADADFAVTNPALLYQPSWQKSVWGWLMLSGKLLGCEPLVHHNRGNNGTLMIWGFLTEQFGVLLQ